MEPLDSSQYLPSKCGLKRLLVVLKKSLGYQFWKRKLRKYLRGEPLYRELTFVEIGCGQGIFSNELGRWFEESNVISGDIDISLIRSAKNQFPNISYLLFDGQQLPIKDSSVHLVSIIQVIEHIENPDLVLAEVFRILTHKGIFILSTPNPRGIAAKMLGDQWQGVKDDHVSIKNPDEWRIAIKNSKLYVLEDGSTSLTGFSIFRWFPFALLVYLPMFLFGFFQWELGESYVVIGIKS